MIYNLRIKFIKIATASVLGVLLLIYAGIFVMNTVQLDSDMDRLTNMLSDNGGRFPDSKPPKEAGHMDGLGNEGSKALSPKEIMDKETRFATRFFVVRIGNDGQIISTDIASIASVDEKQAESFAKEVVETNKDRGWYSSFRYKLTRNEQGASVIFVDGSNNQNMLKNSLISAAAILIGCGLLVILLIVFFSKRAVKPVAESYEKQKQFITDANHELKTPLTLILANLDIAEAELGPNEWLDDIRYEGEQMTVLVNKLVSLSRMDEDGRQLEKKQFNLTETCLDITSEFQLAAEARGYSFATDIADNVSYTGDESAIRQLASILMDNALKYCDPAGSIEFILKGGHHPAITVINSFAEVDNTELDKLFDRFYRSDKARTSGSGYGVGLSIAKAIVTKHGGSILALKYKESTIAFKATL